METTICEQNKVKKNKTSFLKWSSISITRSLLMALAIIWIILFHSNISAPSNIITRAIWYIFVNFGGGIGVDIFLIVSGLGLIYSHNKQNCYATIKNLLRFYYKRFSRIFFSYTLVFTIWYIFHSYQNGGSFVDFISKYTIYEFFSTGFREFWYIHAISILYLIFPLIALLYDKLNHHISFIITLVLSIIIELFFFVFLFDMYQNIEIFLTRIPCFVIGCYFGYLALNNKRICLGLYISSCAVFILSIVGSLLLIHYNVGGQRLVRYLFIITSTSLVISICPLLSVIINKLIFLSWYGKFTLQIYLTHIVLYMVFNNYILINEYLTTLVIFITSGAISIALFYFEKWLLHISKKCFNQIIQQ